MRLGIRLSIEEFDIGLKKLSEAFKIYAPVCLKGKNTFSDVDLIRYEEIDSIKDIEFDRKSHYSSKEVVLPVTQTLFYFTEDKFSEPEVFTKGIIVFLRSCDIHSYKRLDEIYLNNKFSDKYYKVLREKVKFVLMGCENSFENCFCTSMGTNKTEEYSVYVKPIGDMVFMDIKDEIFYGVFQGEQLEVVPDFVLENEINVKISDKINEKVNELPMWREYDSRCIACGRCNFACPTCTCNTMQDIYYKENKNVGERRRVWSSCHVDGFTDMAGGHNFRKSNGDRMRFKVLHKIYDYKKRFGTHMCTGCGRCDDICPQYISFSNCVNKLSEAVESEGEE
jgi:anaerobic sulfite reductase subunit A